MLQNKSKCKEIACDSGMINMRSLTRYKKLNALPAEETSITRQIFETSQYQ